MQIPLPLSAKGTRFIMARTKLAFDQFGIEEPADSIIDKIIDQFNETYHGTITIDELLLHPRDAVAFCDQVRTRHHWFGLPDDMILRPIITRRKNPNG